MKKLNSLLVIALLAMPTFVSCSSDDSAEEAQSAETAQAATPAQKAMAARIADGLTEIMANKDGDYDDGGYIVYSAKEDSMVVVSDLVYGLGNVFYDRMSGKLSVSAQ